LERIAISARLIFEREGEKKRWKWSLTRKDFTIKYNAMNGKISHL